MAIRLVAIASTLGVSVATCPSVGTSLIQVQREILREGQESSVSSAPAQDVAVCHGCLFHDGCDEGSEMDRALCELDGGIWHVESKDELLIDDEIAEFTTLQSLDFNEDGDVGIEEIKLFLASMGQPQSDKLAMSLQGQVSELLSEEPMSLTATASNLSLVERKAGTEFFFSTIATVFAVAAVFSTGAAAVQHAASGGNMFDFVVDYIVDTVTDPCSYVPGGKQWRKGRRLVKAVDTFCAGLGHYLNARDVRGIVFGGTKSSAASSANTKCPRPHNWCTHSGALYLAADCDGDGIQDHYCSDSRHSGFISSMNCQDLWRRAQCGLGRSSSGSSTPLYVFVYFGTCDQYGYEFITTKAECEAAGTSLGVVHKVLTAGGNRQKYCGTWDHNTWLQFNPQASGILNGHAILQRADGFTWQVCKNSDYAFVKSGTCEENGYHFIKTKAECEAAGTSLGVVHKILTAGGNRQKYCGTWDHSTWLQFNPQASGILNGHAILQRADGFTWQVCRKSAPSL